MGRSPSAVAETLSGMGRLTELRQRILFVLGALIIFRIGTFIPVPGINPAALMQLMDAQRGTIVDMFNMFTGGALSRFSLFALGVMPYISASIIIQLMSTAIPHLQQLKKEGQSGRNKITQYTRYFTVLLSAFQGGGVAFALAQRTGLIIYALFDNAGQAATAREKLQKSGVYGVRVVVCHRDENRRNFRFLQSAFQQNLVAEHLRVHR